MVQVVITILILFFKQVLLQLVGDQLHFTGTFAPEEAFSNLYGTANGTWELRVYDDYSADIGVVSDWSISLCGGSVTSINPTFNDITIANADVTLADPMDITGTLTLTAGDIISDATNKLTH